MVPASVRSLSPFPPMRMGGPGVLGHRVAGKPGRPRWRQPRVFTGMCVSRGTQPLTLGLRARRRFSGRAPKAWVLKGEASAGGGAGASLALTGALGPPLQVEKRRVNLPRALSAPPVAGTACHAYDREVHLRCELGPGFYLAVPSTFLKDVPGQFLLRVFSTGRVALR